jgi:membrane-associated protease RseP (regulator of RpoE activity)
MPEQGADDAVSERPSHEASAGSVVRSPWFHLALFVATVASTFWAGALMQGEERTPWRGWTFAVPLLAILVTHEMGHYVFGRRHHVDVSLPYFVPLPLPPLGTLGAIISMRGRIKTRDALLDVGASGPIAGLLVAIPVLAIGLRLSEVHAIGEHGLDEGQSLFYLAMKRIFVGPIPDGHDVFLHPTAFAGWAGLFMTMLNLMPVAQLDGGHIAYALFGKRQDVYSRRFRFGILGVAVAVGLFSATKALRAHASLREIAQALLVGQNWLVWFVLLWLLTRAGGEEHPPTDNETLSPKRRVIAWAMLATFVLLFMPIPFSSH